MVPPRRLVLPHRLILPAVATAILASAVLTGCVDEPGPLPGQTATASPSSPKPSGSATSTPSASATPTPTDAPATPIDADCATLIPLQALYDLDPNLALLGDDAPTGAAAEAVAAGGVACALVHTSSGQRIEVAVSAPGSAALAAARAAAGDAYDLGIPGLDGFASGDTVQGFTGEHRYSAQAAGGDAELLAAVLAIPFAVIG